MQEHPSFTQEQADRLSSRLQSLHDSLSPDEQRVLMAILRQAAEGATTTDDTPSGVTYAGGRVKVTITSVSGGATGSGASQVTIPIDPEAQT